MRLAGLIATFVWISATVVLAQAPSSKAPTEADSEAETAPAIQLGQVPDRAVATQSALDALLPSGVSGQALERIESELDSVLEEIDPRSAMSREALAAEPNVRVLQSIEAKLKEDLKRL